MTTNVSHVAPSTNYPGSWAAWTEHATGEVDFEDGLPSYAVAVHFTHWFLMAPGRYPMGPAFAAAHREQAPVAVAWGRPETDPCERGTSGCSVLHGSADTPCEGW